MNAKHLLIVDDEPDIGEFICSAAQMNGFEARTTHQAREFEQLYSSDIDVIILDLFMPEYDGVELLRFLAKQDSAAKIILISGHDIGVLRSAKKLACEQGLNIVDTLCKPIQYEDLKTLLCNLPATEKHQAKETRQELGSPGKDELTTAFNQNELEAYFQPQLNMADGALVGAEALVRWNHPTRGLLAPNTIIPLAKRTRMMGRLTTEILEQSFRQASIWLQSGIKTQVAINIEACDLKNLSLPEWISDRIDKYQLEPEQIALEVTESSLMQELTKSLDILTRLRMKGLKLSIDDFGTGYSSLLQLYRIPFSEMKIDRSFVMHATTDAEALAIVEMTILLGHKLGMKVVAEGIENQETWDLLSSLGCDVAQGYFIAKPMPGDQLINRGLDALWIDQDDLCPDSALYNADGFS